MPTPAAKRCCTCKQELPLESFSKNRSRKNGYATWCKICTHKKQHDQHISGSDDCRKVQLRGSLRTNNCWKFTPYQAKPTISNLKNLNDQEFLNALQDMLILPTEYVKFINAEIIRRPAIYDDLIRLVLRHDPSHQKAIAASW